ncbi:MAG: RidA family protein [Smithellaceae bacterium]|nr:RidA family protein [Smithellaceae bacterium]
MEKITYCVEQLPRVGPYSHAVEAGGFVFASGVVPVNLAKGLAIKDDVTAATELVLENIKLVLANAGTDLSRVVKATVFLRDMADYQAVNEVYARYFPVDPPARSCVAVKELPGNYPVEIEVIAWK